MVGVTLSEGFLVIYCFVCLFVNVKAVIHCMIFVLSSSGCPSASSFCRPYVLLPKCLMNGLSNLDETYREYSLAPINDLIVFWRSNVKVTAGRPGGEGIHVDAGTSNSIFLLPNTGFSSFYSSLPELLHVRPAVSKVNV